ncbi:hypothetical protein QT711_12755 [Sporosarcina saromensis]|uniref:Lipoprotein n=1 Tax=Sporosarcina saromensis TaxID=359365 RepID=A0ABU4GAP9_9BACL|nr:hypothetical protein [Sporosarcina saromensis]MDW0114059.1 hypothetical protein [Sporosarcina saromensis]
MFKKAIPLVLVSGFALAGCGNDEVPDNNETPMEELDNGLRDMTPRVNNGAGPDMDGIDNGNGNNNVDDGIINDDNRYDGNMNGDNGMDDGIITDDGVTTPDDTQMDDRDQRNGMNDR